MISNNYVLWLPSWYPNLLQPFNGDFIQRHARAVAMHQKIVVVHVLRDKEGSITKDVKQQTFINGQLEEHIIYYYISSKGIRFSEKLRSFFTYNHLYKEKIKEIFREKGKPQLVHVYIAMKAGIIGRWIKASFNIPYVITEQWTIYLSEANPNFQQSPFYFKHLWKKVFNQASGVSVVSDYLGNQLKQLFFLKDFKVIPNVVDEATFKPAFKTIEPEKHFIHISTLDYQKNPEQIIEAFSIVKQTHHFFKLHIVGPEHQQLKELVNNNNLQLHIRFHQEMPHPQLVNLIQQSDALILYSRYETFGCVLIEANACGIPVIVSDIAVIRENIEEGVNGLFAAKENPSALAETIISFMEKRISFDTGKIAELTINKFNFSKVGLQFSNWYQQVLYKQKL